MVSTEYSTKQYTCVIASAVAFNCDSREKKTLVYI